LIQLAPELVRDVKSRMRGKEEEEGEEGERELRVLFEGIDGVV